jgi:hypothetical protein
MSRYYPDTLSVLQGILPVWFLIWHFNDVATEFSEPFATP